MDEEKKICPLLYVTPGFNSFSKNPFCRKDLCAWWNPHLQCCGISAMRQSNE